MPQMNCSKFSSRIPALNSQFSKDSLARWPYTCDGNLGELVTMEGITDCAWKARRAALLGLIGCTALVLQPAHNQLFAQTSPAAAEAPRILERCFQCHGEGVQMGELDLHNRAAMMKGGDSGAVVVPGNAEGSILYQRVAGKVAPIMPMKPVAPLNAKELEIIKS